SFRMFGGLEVQKIHLPTKHTKRHEISELKIGRFTKKNLRYLRFLLLERNSGAALVTAPPATTDHLSPVTRLRARLLRASWESGAHGRGCGVGRGLGVALGGAVGVGVGDSGIEGVGVGDGGIVAVGVAEGVGVGGGVTGGGVGVGVGVVPGTQGVTVGVGVGVAGGGVGGGFPTAVAILTRPQP